MRRVTRRDFIRRYRTRREEIALADRIEAEIMGRMPPPCPDPSAHFPRQTPAPIATAPEGGGMADLAPPPVPSAAEGRRIVKLDLKNAPSSMERLAESWRGR